MEKSAKKKKKRGRTPMEAAMYFYSKKERTVREVERYLDAQEFGEYEVAQAVGEMVELGYLDDKAYAEEFVSSRLATKPVSRRKLREQLTAHELPADIIDEALKKVPDEQEQENAHLIAKKFSAQLAGIEDERERYQRLMRRLLSRGYSYEDARRAIAELNSEGE